MKVAIIGAGNVGKALGGSLVRAGHQVTLAARDVSAVGEAASAIGGRAATCGGGAAWTAGRLGTKASLETGFRSTTRRYL